MQLTEHRNERSFFLRRADATSAVVVDRTVTKSFAVSAESIVEDFPYTKSDQLDDAAIEKISALNPEVVLLGTGERYPTRLYNGYGEWVAGLDAGA